MESISPRITSIASLPDRFCSIDADVNRCADSVLQYPDGTVTMARGASNAEIAVVAKELDHSSITEKLVALLTL